MLPVILFGVMATAVWKIVNARLVARVLAAQPVDPPIQHTAFTTQQAALTALRPQAVTPPGVVPLRGTPPSTGAFVGAWLKRHPTFRPFRFLGIEQNAFELLDKMILVLGKPGTGKTTAMKGLTYEVIQALFGPDPVAAKARLVMIDPTGAFRDLVFSLTPTTVDIFDLSLSSADGYFWDVSKDIRTGADAITLIETLKGDAYAKSNADPFWVNTPTMLFQELVQPLIERQGAWRLSTLVRAMRFSAFARAFLRTTTSGRAFADEHLKAKLGQEIVLSAQAMFQKFTAAAELESQATLGVSMREFLEKDHAVLYVRFDQKSIKPEGAQVSAMLQTLGTQLLSREVSRHADLTYFVLDEGAYLSDLNFIADLAKKGRNYGAGVCLSVLGIPTMVQAFGEKPAQELMALPRMTVCFACDADTAEAFTKLVGSYEATLTIESTQTQTSKSTSWGYSGNNGTWTEGYTTGTTTSHNVSHVVRQALLPGELTTLPTPDNPTRPGFWSAYAFTSDSGAYFVQASVRTEADHTLGIVHYPVTARTPQTLRPFTADELNAMHMTPDIDAPDIQEALDKYKT